MSAAERKRRIVEEALNERRRFRRVHLSRDGRAFFPATAEETPCRVEDISVGGANIVGEFARRPAGKAILHLGSLGQYEGPVMSVSKRGFTMAFSCSPQKRRRLADLLTIELNLCAASEPA